MASIAFVTDEDAVFELVLNVMQNVNIAYVSGAQIVVLNDAGWGTDTVESEAKVKLLPGYGVNDVDMVITLFIKVMYQVASPVF